MSKRLLLISNSTPHGAGYFDHVAEEIKEFLAEINSVLFIPYALADHDMYEDIVKKRFEEMGIELKSIHRFNDLKKAVKEAQAIFIGGGNTFRLLNELYKKEILDLIKQKVESGMPYIGSSAGSNLAAPTIKTTNDMPIIYPPSFEALNLVEFQINPHFLDTAPSSTHMGETREQRLKEFHEENEYPVIGLREGAWLRIEGEEVVLKGNTGAKVFRKGKNPTEHKSGSRLKF